jgi:hypothetical protein
VNKGSQVKGEIRRMEKQMDTSEYSDKYCKYTVNKEEKDEIDDLIEELEARLEL